MRKIICGMLCAVLLLGLAGCSQFKDAALGLAGITENQDYQTYSDLQEKGELDEDGHYAASNVQEAPQGSVQVSFAENSCLDVEYYTDTACTEPIKSAVWYLEPGDAVYAKEPEVVAKFGAFYEFEGFKLYTYDEEGNRSDFSQEDVGNGVVLRIPEGWQNVSFSVVPMGHYITKTLTLEDSLIGDAGTRKPLNDGKWTVNDMVAESGELKVHPVNSYLVDYTYDPQTYYVVKTEPAAYTQIEGQVQFEEVSAGSDVEKFSVELALYKKVDIQVVLEESLGSRKLDLLEGNKAASLVYDKKGEKEGKGRIAFQGEKDGKALALRSLEPITEGNALKLVITKKNDAGEEQSTVQYWVPSNGTFDLNLYNSPQGEPFNCKEATVTISQVKVVNYESVSVENGAVSVSIKEGGWELQDGSVLEKNCEIQVTITPKDGYAVKGSKEESGIYSETMKYEKWEKDSKKILDEHLCEKCVWITLEPADEHGTCVYKLEGEEVKGKVLAHPGSKLEMEYTLTDEEYKVKWDLTSIMNKLGKHPSITITADMDGKTITREDFELEVKKKE